MKILCDVTYGMKIEFFDWKLRRTENVPLPV